MISTCFFNSFCSTFSSSGQGFVVFVFYLTPLNGQLFSSWLSCGTGMWLNDAVVEVSDTGNLSLNKPSPGTDKSVKISLNLLDHQLLYDLLQTFGDWGFDNSLKDLSENMDCIKLRANKTWGDTMFIAIVKKVNCTPFIAFSSLTLLSGKSKIFCSVL